MCSLTFLRLSLPHPQNRTGKSPACASRWVRSHKLLFVLSAHTQDWSVYEHHTSSCLKWYVHHYKEFGHEPVLHFTVLPQKYHAGFKTPSSVDSRWWEVALCIAFGSRNHQRVSFFSPGCPLKTEKKLLLTSMKVMTHLKQEQRLLHQGRWTCWVRSWTRWARTARTRGSWRQPGAWTSSGRWMR